MRSSFFLFGDAIRQQMTRRKKKKLSGRGHKMPPPPPKHRQHFAAAAAKGSHNNARVSSTKQKTKGAAAPKPAASRPSPTTSTSTSTSPPPSTSTSTSKALPGLLPAPLASRPEGEHRPVSLVLASSLLMQAAVDVFEKTGTFFLAAGAAEAAAAAASSSSSSAVVSSASSSPLPPGTPALVGAALGLLYACALLPLARRTAWAAPPRALRAVVTGGSAGLGKALAREHALAGDSVVVAARDRGRLLRAARELSEETGAELVLLADGGDGEEEEEGEGGKGEGGGSGGGLSSSSSSLAPPLPSPPPRPTITPIVCDVSDPASVARLVYESMRAFGGGRGGGRGDATTIDCFYNNAGDSGSFRSFLGSDPEALARVVSTNLLGAVLCTRAAMEAMTEGQREGSPLGHIFLVEGAGSDGLATPGHAAYGATKAATAQLVKSLAAEAAAAAAAAAAKPPQSSPVSSSSSSSPPPSPAVVGFHALSPGLVLTPLLLDGLFPLSSAPSGPGGGEERGPEPLEAPFEVKMRALAFDALAEHPETAAAFLVPRARSLVAAGDRSSAVRSLTPLCAAARLLSAPLRRGRHFDAGTATPRWDRADRGRLFGLESAEGSARDRARAAARGGSLALSFAASSAALFLVLVTW